VRLALKPKVLLLDEPTANVDEASALLIKEAVARARADWGATIVTATHDLAWLHDVANRIIGMYGGKIIDDGVANLIRGNWRIDGSDKRSASITLRGVKITANSPGGSISNCAILNPSDITIIAPHEVPPNGCNAISGTLQQMTMERTTGNILCAADCGGIFLKVRVSPKSARELALCPGMCLILSFPRDALKFIPSLL
jgi:tungstate transport system ATP-binding protein